MALALEDDKRQMTALAIAETRADILCLQEVDSLRVLDAFFANYVHRVADTRYGHFRLVEGNDRRGIDVAFACRRTLPGDDPVATSHKEATFADFDVWDRDIGAFGIRPDDRVFNRDCLMVDVDMGKRALTLFIVHLKSMNNGRDDGRRATTPLRRAEARAVRALSSAVSAQAGATRPGSSQGISTTTPAAWQGTGARTPEPPASIRCSTASP